MTLMCESLERFVESIENYASQKPDRRFAVGSIRGASSMIARRSDEDMNKRVSDFIIPYEYFADTMTIEDLERARGDLIATASMKESDLQMDHKDVYTSEEFIEAVRDVAADVDDPVVICAHFSPGSGSYQIYAGDNEKPRRIGSLTFPESMFSSPGCAPIRQMHVAFRGLLVFERSDLSDPAQAMADGEIESVELEDRYPDRLEPSEVYETLKSLSVGDRVLFNDRKRPLRVVPVEESSFFAYSNTECMFLEAHGSDYRVALREDKYSELETDHDSEYITEIEVVDRADTDDQKVTA